MSVVLRKAALDDVPEIMGMETAIFVTDAWSSEIMRNEIRNPHCFYRVAVASTDPQKIIGYAGLCAPDGASTADIHTIAVDAKWRGKGIGRLLMRALVTEAARRQVADVMLEVRADNQPAQELYRSLGFETIHVRHRYYQPDNVDALVMRLTGAESTQGQTTDPHSAGVSGVPKPAGTGSTSDREA